MDFSWSSAQEEFFGSVAALAGAGSMNTVVENDRRSVFNVDGWKTCGEFGIMGLPVPRGYGGLGHDPLTTAGALERLGYACKDNGLLFSINAHIWTVCMPLVAFGSEEQKASYLPRLCNGQSIGASSISEAESGSDVYNLQAIAAKTTDGYVLNGSKKWVTNGPIADLFVIYATVDPAKGAHGVTAFLVEKQTPGLTVSDAIDTMGIRTSPLSGVTLVNCQIPLRNRLGNEGAGMALFTHAMIWERGLILASAVGAMQRLLERCIQYAKTRKQFGQPIGKFQLVAQKIADMKLRVETSRYLLYHSAWLRSQGKKAILEASMTKLHVSESWVQNCQDALQIHGAYGYATELEIERELRDAIASRIYSGTNEIQKNIVASLLGL